MLQALKPKQGSAPVAALGDVKAIDALPVAVMSCNIETFLIDYANPRSVELLQSIAHVLNFNPAEIVGTCIDVFHKNPQHQRTMLADPANLPHEAQIEIGGETLSLRINALHDSSGRYTHALLTWNVITEKVRADRNSKRLIQMIDKMPINVMTCDLDFNINYVNQTSLTTLKKVEEHLPIKVDELLGSSIDIFHKHPEHQQKMLRDPSNLPHTANIRLGPEVLNLRVSAIRSEDGEYLGPMLTWSIITDQVAMADSVSEVVASMAERSNQMDASATDMLRLASEANSLAASVSAAAEQMTASVEEISGQMSQVAGMSQEATDQAKRTDDQVSTLDETATRIGQMTEMIESIADQTKLLALNATIEAARAGESGKGFAVVAAEVKSLSGQTAKATEEIKTQISEIQSVTSDAVEAICAIRKTIEKLNEISAAVAAAVEEQGAATAEVARSISGVSEASNATGDAAKAVRDVAEDVSTFSSRLNGEIETFLDNTKNN